MQTETNRPELKTPVGWVKVAKEAGSDDFNLVTCDKVIADFIGDRFHDLRDVSIRSSGVEVTHFVFRCDVEGLEGMVKAVFRKAK